MGGDSKDSKPKAHLADAKALLDSRGLYEGQTFHGVNPLLLVEKIIRYFLLHQKIPSLPLTTGLGAETASSTRSTGKNNVSVSTQQHS
jgi:hypothetical protein